MITENSLKESKRGVGESKCSVKVSVCIWFFSASPPNIELFLDTFGFDVECFKSKANSKACWQSHYLGCRSMIFVLKCTYETTAAGIILWGRPLKHVTIYIHLSLFMSMSNYWFSETLSNHRRPFHFITVAERMPLQVRCSWSASDFQYPSCSFFLNFHSEVVPIRTTKHDYTGGYDNMWQLVWGRRLLYDVTKCLQPYNSQLVYPCTHMYMNLYVPELTVVAGGSIRTHFPFRQASTCQQSAVWLLLFEKVQDMRRHVNVKQWLGFWSVPLAVQLKGPRWSKTQSFSTKDPRKESPRGAESNLSVNGEMFPEKQLLDALNPFESMSKPQEFTNKQVSY